MTKTAKIKYEYGQVTDNCNTPNRIINIFNQLLPINLFHLLGKLLFIGIVLLSLNKESVVASIKGFLFERIDDSLELKYDKIYDILQDNNGFIPHY